jgi:hypothetical protein
VAPPKPQIEEKKLQILKREKMCKIQRKTYRMAISLEVRHKRTHTTSASYSQDTPFNPLL